MDSTYRVETAAARLIKTKARDTPGTTLVLSGFDEKSGTAADLKRSGLELSFLGAGASPVPSPSCEAICAFEQIEMALAWCRIDTTRRNANTADADGSTEDDLAEKANARRRFLSLFGDTGYGNAELLTDDIAQPDDRSDETTVRIFKAAPSSLFHRPLGDEKSAKLLGVISGALRFQMSVENVQPPGARPARYNRDSLSQAMVTTARYAFATAQQWIVMLRSGGRETAERPAAGSGSFETSLSNSSSDAEAKGKEHERRRASAGDSFFVWAGEPRLTLDSNVTTEVKACRVDSGSALVTWPEDSLAAVVEEGHDVPPLSSSQAHGERKKITLAESCWLVEISCSVASLEGRASWDDARREMIRRAVVKLGSGIV